MTFLHMSVGSKPSGQSDPVYFSVRVGSCDQCEPLQPGDGAEGGAAFRLNTSGLHLGNPREGHWRVGTRGGKAHSA